MKRILITLFVLSSLTLQAQNLKSQLLPSFEVKVGQGIEFYSHPYNDYRELPRTSVLVQTNYNIFMFAAGYDYILMMRSGSHESAVNVRGGIQMDLGRRFSWDTYISAEKIFHTAEPIPMLFGYGLSCSFRLGGIIHIFADLRAEYPLFQQRYTYYKTLSTCASVGIKLKFQYK